MTVKGRAEGCRHAAFSRVRPEALLAPTREYWGRSCEGRCRLAMGNCVDAYGAVDSFVISVRAQRSRPSLQELLAEDEQSQSQVWGWSTLVVRGGSEEAAWAWVT